MGSRDKDEDITRMVEEYGADAVTKALLGNWQEVAETMDYPQDAYRVIHPDYAYLAIMNADVLLLAHDDYAIALESLDHYGEEGSFERAWNRLEEIAKESPEIAMEIVDLRGVTWCRDSTRV
jgi:hypothetical protein